MARSNITAQNHSRRIVELAITVQNACFNSHWSTASTALAEMVKESVACTGAIMDIEYQDGGAMDAIQDMQKAVTSAVKALPAARTPAPTS